MTTEADRLATMRLSGMEATDDPGHDLRERPRPYAERGRGTRMGEAHGRGSNGADNGHKKGTSVHSDYS